MADTGMEDNGQQVRLERKKLTTTRNPIIALSKGQMFSTQTQTSKKTEEAHAKKRPNKPSLTVSKAQDSDSSDSENCSKQHSKQKQTVLKLSQRKLSMSHREGTGPVRGQPLVQLTSDNTAKNEHKGSFDNKSESNHPQTLGSQETVAKQYAPSSRANLQRLIKNPSMQQISQELSSLHTKSFNLNNVQLPASLQRSNFVASRGISRNGGSGARLRPVPSLVQSAIPENREQKKTAIKIQEVFHPQSDPANIETLAIE